MLVSLGADAGALTDPSPELPLGKTAADLAYANGHRGISGFLAESSLTSYLEKLTVDSKENSPANSSGAKAVQTVSERTAAPMSYGDVPEKLSLKDSLTAVRNATQAADRLHQVFRMQSFQRKQLSDIGDDDKIDISDKLAVSFATLKTKNPGQGDVSLSSAATHIQKKYRGWKKRKEFLLIRQRIVKIQVCLSLVFFSAFISFHKSFVWFLIAGIILHLPLGSCERTSGPETIPNSHLVCGITRKNHFALETQR